MSQPENGQPAPSASEAPSSTVGPILPEFSLEPNAVGLIALAGIDKLVTSAQNGGRSPMVAVEGEDRLNLVQLGKNMRGEGEARMLALALDLLAPRTDAPDLAAQRATDGLERRSTWMDFLEVEAAKRVAQAEAGAGDAPA